jgi:hypothetical protein
VSATDQLRGYLEHWLSPDEVRDAIRIHLDGENAAWAEGYSLGVCAALRGDVVRSETEPLTLRPPEGFVAPTEG